MEKCAKQCPARPVHYLQWHITHRCNLRCAHCYQEDYTHFMPWDDMMDALDKFERLITARGQQAQVNLTGGEPLLHPDFWRLAQEIRRRGMNMAVLTNGTLIGPEEAARLAALKPVFVQISLDGMRKKHDAIRGQGSFKKAMAGIDCLRAADVKVLVSFTAQRSNIGDFPGLAIQCKRHRVNKLWWDRVVTDTPEDAARLALTDAQFRWMCIQGNFIRNLYKDWHFRSMVDNRRALQFYGGFERGHCGYVCGAGRKNLLIFLADGGIMACRRLPFVIGRIRDGELEDTIAASPDMQRLAALCGQVPRGCEGCKQLDRCHGGAKCVTYGQTGELDRRDVNCPFRHTVIPPAGK